MASQDEEVLYRNFHGRSIKVTMCDADPEFTSKVARIQDEIIARTLAQVTSNQNSDLIPQVPDPDVGDSSELVSVDVSSGLNIDLSDNSEQGPGKDDAMKPEEFEPVIPGPSLDAGPGISPSFPSVTQAHNDGINGLDFDQNIPTPNTTANDSDTPVLLEPRTDSIFQPDAVTESDTLESQAELPIDSRNAPLNESLDHGTGLSVFNRVDLEQYAEYEWKGTTPTAALMRRGYQQMIDVTSLSSMRKIRGDNYCGLRASCFQILSQSLNCLKTWADNFDDIPEIPQSLLQNHGCTWLTQWSFAGRLKVTPKKRLDTMKNCLQRFCEEIQISRSIGSDQERIDHVLEYFNSSKPDEVLLFEAMKVLMLHSAVTLYERMAKEEDVPVFAWLLFARDTSENPEQLMLNHLNAAGDTGGLEQVEMFLLGYALNITIRVLRPSQLGEDDFVTHFPDDHLDDWDSCNLIAEDDRHYNVIVP